MTAAAGIIHQEMPRGDQAVRMHGFQLWANLPAALKMTPPRYQGIEAADIPVVTDDDGSRCAWSRKILGKDRSRRRRCHDPIYIDVSCRRDSERRFPSKRRATRFATYSRARGNSATRRDLSKVPTEPVSWADTNPPAAAENRSLVLSIEAMKSWCRLATTAYASYSSREASARARGLVWPHRDEHAGAAPPGIRELEKGTFLKSAQKK